MFTRVLMSVCDVAQFVIRFRLSIVGVVGDIEKAYFNMGLQVQDVATRGNCPEENESSIW